ncbi:hypothetical protein [Dethiothermospora halolimnae]|uniref:hypothetical protein n=1 Tax=Dethiothermospora halolimnae TaxID=3114390 RepID=UPI003CCBE202
MIKLIYGPEGSGKTTKLIDMANGEVKTTDGNIVFVDADNSNMLNLNHDIRLINAMEFDIDNIESFRGFLCGIMAENYDITKIYIDGIYKILDVGVEEIRKLIKEVMNKHSIGFVLSVNSTMTELPDDLQKYIIS